MKEQHINWYSPILGKQMDMLVFGESGYPLIVFPTSMGSYTQNKDFYLIDSVSEFVDNGTFKIFTPASIDSDSWYNKNIHPIDRVQNHMLYDKFILEEVVVPALKNTGHEKAAFAGCSFGAYHATNFGLRHPELTGYIINMGGAFNIKDQVNGYYDSNIYFNNPPDYLPGLNDTRLNDIGFIFGTGTNDMCMEANVQLTDMLQKKGINYWLDIREGAEHDWPVWRDMFPAYLNAIVEEKSFK